MGSFGSKDKRGQAGERASRNALLYALFLGALSLLLALVVAGCGDGDQTTTTLETTPALEETTTSATEPTAEETTSTTLPILESTTTTAASEETTTTTTAGGTTTTERLSSAETMLPNGNIRAMGFIKRVWEEAGKQYISIDYAQMLTGQAAIDAAVEAGDLEPGEDLPNDYYISNVNPEQRRFEVSDSAAITVSTWHGSPEDPEPITWDVFKSLWSSTPPEDATYLRDSPWWIERDGQVVVKIDEQYLP